jgi:hypothetical protein
MLVSVNHHSNPIYENKFEVDLPNPIGNSIETHENLANVKNDNDEFLQGLNQLPIEIINRIRKDTLLYYPKKKLLCKSFNVQHEIKKKYVHYFENKKCISLDGIHVNAFSLLDLYFSNPYLETLHLDVLFFQEPNFSTNGGSRRFISEEEVIKNFQIISMFPNLKTLKLSNFSPDYLHLYLDKLSTCEKLENLILDFNYYYRSKECLTINSSFIEKISHIKNLKNLDIMNYDPEEIGKVIDDIGNLKQIIALSYSNHKWQKVNNAIMKTGLYFSYPKQIKPFSLNSYEKLPRSILGGGALLAGIYGLLSLISDSFLTYSPISGLPASISAPSLIPKPLDTVNIYAIGAFLALSAGLAAYYSKFRTGQIQKKPKAKIITNNSTKPVSDSQY